MGARVICHPSLHQHSKQEWNKDQCLSGGLERPPSQKIILRKDTRGRNLLRATLRPPQSASGRPTHPQAKWVARWRRKAVAPQLWAGQKG